MLPAIVEPFDLFDLLLHRVPLWAKYPRGFRLLRFNLRSRRFRMRSTGFRKSESNLSGNI
jgi:hypothetical protein